MNILPIVDQEDGQDVTDKLNTVIGIINALEQDYVKKTGTGLADMLNGDFWVDPNQPTRIMTDDATFRNGLMYYGAAGTSFITQKISDDSYAGVIVADGNRVMLQSQNYTDGFNVSLEVTDEEMNVSSGNPFFKGIQGDAEYWLLSDAKTFIQRGYVDNNFLPYIGAVNDLDLGLFSIMATGASFETLYGYDLFVGHDFIDAYGHKVMDVENRLLYEGSGTKVVFDIEGRMLNSPDLGAALRWDNNTVEFSRKLTFINTAAATMNIPDSGPIASPAPGDIWRDGQDLKIYIGGVIKKFSLA